MQEAICVMRAAMSRVIVNVLKVIKAIIILSNAIKVVLGVTEAISHSYER